MRAAGIEVGSVTLKRVILSADGEYEATATRHEGRPLPILQSVVRELEQHDSVLLAATGQATRVLTDVPYWPETICLERALKYYRAKPNILLSLGGESFVLFALQEGMIRSLATAPKCAAGSGEFLVQQFQRLGLTLEEGIAAADAGTRVSLSGRCSVYFKSDATHKLNKGECDINDIALSLLHDLCDKIQRLIEDSRWDRETIALAGGLTRNAKLVSLLRDRLPGSNLLVFDTSHCFEAFGAALCALDDKGETRTRPAAARPSRNPLPYATLEALAGLSESVVVKAPVLAGWSNGEDSRLILCVDAGSTTTKAILVGLEDGGVRARCYLRTHGNPVLATKHCLRAIRDECGDRPLNIVQSAVTGSGRQLVSVFLDAAMSFNEILAHARAAVAEVRDVETVFEIGGQDSKYVGLIGGIPIDYAMNDGCSAGTGSFLEETVVNDMDIPMEEIAPRAMKARSPFAFGERCAAFINTDIRNALRQGAEIDDVIAGLVYSVVRNYLTRVVGNRHIAETILFQGGVALNRAVAAAIAALSGKRVVVPPNPELMGCIGAGLLLKDMLLAGEVGERPLVISSMLDAEFEKRTPFHCPACENRCEIERIAVHGRVYPFGGLCSKYELTRPSSSKGSHGVGRDIVAERNNLLLGNLVAQSGERTKRVGIPLALWSYEYLGLFSRFFAELGYEVVTTSGRHSSGDKLAASICHPCQIAARKVDELLAEGVDFVFLPHIIEAERTDGGEKSCFCVASNAVPALLRTGCSDYAQRLLSPEIGLSNALRRTTLKNLEAMGRRLGVGRKEVCRSFAAGLTYQQKLEDEYRKLISSFLATLDDEPVVIVAGRPYVVCSPEVNLGIPKKITQRGFHAIPSDMLPRMTPNGGSIWRHTQQLADAISLTKNRTNTFLCLVSCFSCGPDGMALHFAREQMAGETFCYLEIDSHTAHAGFDTRIGAFLDLISDKMKRRS